MTVLNLRVIGSEASAPTPTDTEARLAGSRPARPAAATACKAVFIESDVRERFTAGGGHRWPTCR
jgi:hypothetical protein